MPSKVNPRNEYKGTHEPLLHHLLHLTGPLYQRFAPSPGDSVEGSVPIADVGRDALGDTRGVPEHLHLELKDTQ